MKLISCYEKVNNFIFNYFPIKNDDEKHLKVLLIILFLNVINY